MCRRWIAHIHDPNYGTQSSNSRSPVQNTIWLAVVICSLEGRAVTKRGTIKCRASFPKTKIFHTAKIRPSFTSSAHSSMRTRGLKSVSLVHRPITQTMTDAGSSHVHRINSCTTASEDDWSHKVHAHFKWLPQANGVKWINRQNNIIKV